MTSPSTTLREALSGRYAIERELGGGGMSRVYLAREVALDRHVVVKVIAPELREGLSAERFAREVQLAARLQQANIVPLLSTGVTDDGLPYYTMPYVAGQSLRARIARGPLPSGEALDVLRDVARALAYAHAEGVVHRDVKPENVLLSSGTAVVTDFGIAKALSASRTGAPGGTLTQVGTSLGTPAYMAPEQALGDVVDARADLYAWGVMAYELLAGRHPFASHTTAQRLVAAHIGETPAPLRSARRDVPEHVAAVVMQCLAKDPTRRPTDAREVLDRLAAAGPRRPLGRRWSVAAAAALALVTLFALGTLLRARRLAAPAPTRTVVVVPFDNVGDPADAYFAEGMSDEIAGQLARLPGVAVIGRDGVQRFRGSRRSPREIARELGAAYALSGTVRWARAPSRVPSRTGGVDGDTRVRIVSALVDVATGRQAWGAPYEERLTDVFRVQAAVAERVAAALSVTLGDSTRAALRHPESADPEARDAQLLGRYLLRQRGLDNLRRAESSFARAVARDSTYARAWAGLSEAAALRPVYYDTTEPDSVLRARAAAAARRALALDSTLPEVQLAVARSYSAEFRFNDALRAVRRAVALDPNATLAWALEYEVLTALGQNDEAGAAARRAAELDGFSPLAVNNRAVWFASAGMLDSAVRYSERATEIAPTEVQWRRSLGALYALAGRPRDATRMCEHGVVAANLCVPMVSALAGVAGARDEALSALGAMGRHPGVAGQPMWTAMVYAKLGVADSVFARLDAAVRVHDDAFAHLVTFPQFSRYRSDPRWDAIVGAVRRR